MKAKRSRQTRIRDLRQFSVSSLLANSANPTASPIGVGGATPPFHSAPGGLSAPFVSSINPHQSGGAASPVGYSGSPTSPFGASGTPTPPPQQQPPNANFTGVVAASMMWTPTTSFEASVIGIPTVGLCGDTTQCNLPPFYLERPRKKKWFEEDDEDKQERLALEAHDASLSQATKESIHLLLHSELAYRINLMAQMDSEFCVLVEQAWDVQELLQLSLSETTGRFWQAADWEHGFNSLVVVFRKGSERIEKAASLLGCEVQEAQARGDVVDGYYRGCDECLSAERAGYLAVRRLELDRAAALSREGSMMMMANSNTSSAAEAAATSSRRPSINGATRTRPVAAAEDSNSNGSSSAQQQHSQPGQQAPATATTNDIGGDDNRRKPRPPLGTSTKAHTPSSSAGRRTSDPTATAAPARPPAQQATAVAVRPPQTPRVGLQSDFIEDAETRLRRRLTDSYTRTMDAILVAREQLVGKLSTHTAHSLICDESVGRRLIAFDYFAMLLNAAELLEALTRQEVDVKQRRREFRAFGPEENQKWLQARQREQKRAVAEEADDLEEERQRRYALLEWEQEKENARARVERAEGGARRDDIVFSEASERAILANMQEAQYGPIRALEIRRQVEAEVRAKTLVWTEASHDLLVTSERDGRLDIMREEHLLRQLLEKDETEGFILSRKDEALNEEVARQMRKKYDDPRADSEWREQRAQKRKQRQQQNAAEASAKAAATAQQQQQRAQ